MKLTVSPLAVVLVMVMLLVMMVLLAMVVLVLSMVVLVLSMVVVVMEMVVMVVLALTTTGSSLQMIRLPITKMRGRLARAPLARGRLARGRLVPPTKRVGAEVGAEVGAIVGAIVGAEVATPLVGKQEEGVMQRAMWSGRRSVILWRKRAMRGGMRRHFCGRRMTMLM
jgi:hypothetical protein